MGGLHLAKVLVTGTGSAEFNWAHLQFVANMACRKEMHSIGIVTQATEPGWLGNKLMEELAHL